MISGLASHLTQLLTECWLGLVLSSPAPPMYGTRVRWTNIIARGRRRSDLSHRLQERLPLHVARRAAHFENHHQHVRAGGPPQADAPLISSVMCGITCMVSPR